MSFINKFKEMMGSNEEYAEDADYPVEGNYDDAPQDDYAAGEEPSPKRNKVVNINSTMQLQLIDFLSGVAYANNGQIKRVAASTFIITPYNVDIMGDLLDELESSGVFF